MTLLDNWIEENREVELKKIGLQAGIELFDRLFTEISKEQLPLVGHYLERLSYLLGEHTEEWYADWDRRSSGKELEVEADFFDCFVRQSVGFDPDDFIEPLPNLPRSYDLESKPIEIQVDSIETIIELSHVEDVPGWNRQIKSYLESRGNSCMMAELIDNLPLTPGTIIYTVLLGNFQLEQKGNDFYSCSSLWVELCQHQ